MLPVVREISVRNEDRNGPIRYLLVRVMRPHDPVHITDHDRSDLQRA